MCTKCKEVFPANVEFFIKDSSRPLGLAYECRPCHRHRKSLTRDTRTDRWNLMTDEQRLKAKARNLKYGRTSKGRAIHLRKAYKRIDECDMTSKEVYELIIQPCAHCGTTDLPRGLDRIDNNLPHIKTNVVPSCAPCNFARGNRFTFDEMKLIGAVIRQIFKDRISEKARSEGHPENL